MQLKVLVVLFLNIFLAADCSIYDVKKYIQDNYESSLTQACNEVTKTRIDYYMDLTNEHKRQAYMKSLITSTKIKNDLDRYISRSNIPIHIDDELLKRELKAAGHGLRLGSDKEIKDFVSMYVFMDREFNAAKICPFNKPGCDTLQEGIDIYEIEEIMAKSTDYNKLLYMWKEWREATAKVKNVFVNILRMENNFTKAKGFSNAVEYQQHFFYEPSQIVEDSLRLWEQVEPLYLELHKYVSRKLKIHYGDKLDISDGLLPAHVLGSVWADSWYNIEHLVRPFPNVSDGNLRHNIRDRFEVEDMFHAADNFFQSLGLSPTKSAYNGTNGMITKPDDGRVVTCAPTSADYCNGTYRVTVCGKLDLENYISIHHQLGRVQYFIQYKNLPYLLRGSASPSIQDSIGQSVALSATSPRHLQKLGLLTNYRITYESSINHLMKMALIKVASLPFELIAGLWKLEIASGKLGWNSLWWEYRKKYQKIKPPVPRLSHDNLDPISKYSIRMKTDLLPQFQARIMEFQIYRDFCLTAQEYDPNLDEICPLHTCDFYKSKNVGLKLKNALSLGYIKDWRVVLEMLSGYPHVTTGPLLDYFQPLYEFLIEENKKPMPTTPPPPPAPPVPLTTPQVKAIAVSLTIIGISIVAFVLYVRLSDHGRQFWQRSMQTLRQRLFFWRPRQEVRPEGINL